MTLKAVIFDAGNTVMLINYGMVTEALVAEGSMSMKRQSERG